MAEVKICPVCNKEFRPEGSRKRYCSKECSEEGYRRDQVKRSNARHQRQKENRQVAAGRTKDRSPLEEIAKKARAAGMTYGQYVALEYAKERS